MNNRSMARFSDINRADELKAAQVRLNAWRALDAAAKKASYATATAVGGGKRANRASRTAFIQPFGPVTNFWYETKILADPAQTPAAAVNEENVNTLITAVLVAVTSGYSLTMPVGANNVSDLAKKVQFAKVRVTDKATAFTPTTSRITGRPYNKYASNTISCPYGQGSTTFTSDGVARGIIRTSLGTVSGRTISFTPQSVKLAK